MAEKQEDNIDLINLVLMLNQNALISLGEASRFSGGKKSLNLPHARQTINMLKSIKDKTKNNLNPGETKLVFRLLGDLQAKYVKAAGLDRPGEVNPSNPKRDKIEAALDKFKTEDLAKILADLGKKDKDAEIK
ncbi:MAG: DUF1844 domain-containing protein [Candidatus Goldiibacteriota bacterium]|jgi:hypothetical protein